MAYSAPGTVDKASRLTIRRVIMLTLTVVAVTGLFYLLSRFASVLFIVFVGAVLGTAFRPAVLLLKKRGLPDRLAVTLLFLVALGLIVGGIALLAPLLVTQAGTLVRSLPSYYQQLHDVLTKSSNTIIHNLARYLPASLALQPSATAPIQTPTSTAVAGIGQVIRATSWFVFGTISVLLVAFFWVLDHDQIVKSLLLFVPSDNRTSATTLWEDIESRVGGYVRGTAILGALVGVMSVVVYLMIGIPSAIFIAVVAGVLESIPYVGPLLTAAIALTVTLSEVPGKIVYVLIAAIVIQQIESVIFVPRIMDKQVGVNPIVTLLAIAAFGSLFGILGAIMAIPLGAVVQVLLEAWLLYAEKPLPAIMGRDRVSTLRYQAQDLAHDLRERLRSEDTPDDDDEWEEQVEALVGELDQFLVQMTVPTSPQGAAVRNQL